MKSFQMYRKEFITFFLCFVLFLFSAFFVNHYLNHKYKESFINTYSTILDEVHEKHPELEYEIIEILKSYPNRPSTNLLEQYGFSIDSLNYIKNVDSLIKNTNGVLILFFLFCFFTFLTIVLFYYFRRQKRLNQINEYLFRVLQNDFQYDLGDYNEDSISSLKIDLMKVTNKLRRVSEDSIHDKKNLERTLSDISHQLRTPLTSLYIMNDALCSKNLLKKDRDAFLFQQKEQLERMEWLIVALLKMSQIDSGTIQFHPQKENLNNLMEEALKPILISLELKNIRVDIDIPLSMELICDRRWTVEAILNLVKNACEHTNEYGCVFVKAKDNPMFLELSIEDTGVGIKKEDLSHVFERFYKGNTKTESIGIGLNLSKTIIENQNGTIRVESELEKGTKFILRFYKGII